MTIEIPPGLLPPDDSSLPYRDPALTLGQRCLVWIEMQRAAPWQHIPPAPHPNTNERVRSWFRPAMRNGRPLGLTEGNWCAVFQSAALFACALGPHELIHGYRAAVVELIASMEPSPERDGELIRRGLLTVAEDGTPTYTADGGKTFTFHIPTGATFMAMESHAPNKQVSNTVAAVTEMTRSAAGEISGLSVWDFRAVMRVGSFFLEQ